MEFVSKLYGLIPVDAFPLQIDKRNQGKGFNEPDLLKDVGLVGHECHAILDKTVQDIEEICGNGEFVAVSLINQRGTAMHIFVAGLFGGRICLYEPQGKTFHDLEKMCRSSVKPKINRDKIHYLNLKPFSRNE